MSSSPFDTIQEALEKLSPETPAVMKALKINGDKEMGIFWAGLNAVHEGREIKDFTGVAGKMNKYPAPYFTKLKGRKLIERGDKTGQWLVTDKAINTLQKLIDGNVSAGGADDESGGEARTPKAVRRTKKVTARKKDSRAKKVSKKTKKKVSDKKVGVQKPTDRKFIHDKMNFDEVTEALEEVDRLIEEHETALDPLRKERSVIMKVIAGFYKKIAESIK